MNVPQVQVQAQTEGATTEAGSRRTGAYRCERTDLQAMLDLIGVSIADMPAPTLQPAVRRIRAGELLFLEGAPASSIHVVCTGTFKVFRTAEDGYEQVFGFFRRGDLLGCDALSADHHVMATVALEHSTVFAVGLPDLYALSRSSPSFYRGMMRAVAKSMLHLTQLSDMVAAVASEVRLARFLLHLSQCMSSCGQSARSLRLQMTRRDIGSYLGVAHETISRSFAALVEAGLIEVEQRVVDIRDLDALQRYAQGTRAPARAHRPGGGRAAAALESSAI